MRYPTSNLHDRMDWCPSLHIFMHMINLRPLSGGLRSAFRTLRDLLPSFHACHDITGQQLTASSAALELMDEEEDEEEQEVEEEEDEEELDAALGPVEEGEEDEEYQGGSDGENGVPSEVGTSVSGLAAWVLNHSSHSGRAQRAPRCVIWTTSILISLIYACAVTQCTSSLLTSILNITSCPCHP